jgi:hypothetical protein
MSREDDMADTPEIRTQIGKAKYLEILEPLVIAHVRALRDEADGPPAKAFEAYTDRTVKHAPEDWRADVRSMIERVIRESSH